MYHLLLQFVILRVAECVYVGCMWFSQWTAIVSLNNINHSMSVMVKVLFAVRT
jgi:hypothetical protein